MNKDKATKKLMKVSNATIVGKKFKCKVCNYKGTKFINIDTKNNKKKCCPDCYKKSVDSIIELVEDV